MNKRHYEHTLPNIRGSLSNTYFGKDAKNNRSDSKHGTFRKYGQPPIDTPEETSAIPFKKMKPKNEAYNIPRIEKSDCTIK